jgi:hypothetical protein
MKTCTKCSTTKPVTEYHKFRNGLRPTCEACTNAQNREISMRPNAIERRHARQKQYESLFERKKARAEQSIRMRIKYPEKCKARDALNGAIRWGKIVKQPCEVCGSIEVHAHHEDYSKPLEVKWLCQQHHIEIHR